MQTFWRQLKRPAACHTAAAQAQGSRQAAREPRSTDLVHVRGEERVVRLDATHKAARRDVAALALLPADLQQACAACMRAGCSSSHSGTHPPACTTYATVQEAAAGLRTRLPGAPYSRSSKLIPSPNGVQPTHLQEQLRQAAQHVLRRRLLGGGCSGLQSRAVG